HRRDPGDGADALADLVAQAAALLIAGNAAVDQDGRSLLARGTGDGEGGDVAGFEAGQLLDRPFDILRPVVAPVDDDHVLGAADDEDVAARHVAHIAGVEPTVIAEASFGGVLVAEVAVHDRCAADEHFADAAVGELLAV